MKILDSTGTGFGVKVDKANRLHVASESISHAENHAHSGFGFNIETPVITLTSAAKSSVLYLKNNEDEDIVCVGFFHLLGEITGTLSGDLIYQVEYNTVGGTLIAATSNIITPVNKRVGSNNTVDVTALYGAQGLTVDSGLDSITSLSTGTGRNTLLLQIVLPKGQSVAVSITPFTGTTNMDLISAVDIYHDIADIN